MKLDSPFEQVLEQLPDDRLEQLMLWYCSGGETVETRSKRLQQVLDDVQFLDFETCFQVLNRLELNELVVFSLMNEFGPSFANRPCFAVLAHAVTERLFRQGNRQLKDLTSLN